MNTRTDAIIDRQLQITLSALARSLRKILRVAEQIDPTGEDPIWLCVEQRARLFHDVLAGTIAFNRAIAPAEPAKVETMDAAEEVPTKAVEGVTSEEPAPPLQIVPLPAPSSPSAHCPAKKRSNRQQRRAAKRRPAENASNPHVR